MSSNSGVVLNRAAETSPFYQALKSRNSKSLPELYSSEVNTEAAAQSVVEVECSSNPGYGRTLIVELPRFGLLNKLYLHTRFGKADGVFSTSHFQQQVPFLGAMCIREARLTYNGQTLQKTDGFTIVSKLWKDSDDNQRRHLQELIGAFDFNSSLATNANGDAYDATEVERRAIDSSHNSEDGVQDFYCPLQFYFDAIHSPNRNLDLSILANPVKLEIDMESQSNLFFATNAAITTLSPLLNVSAMCYLTELDPEVEKTYRALTYIPGSQPKTEIAFNTERVVVTTNFTHSSADSTVDVKLNQFTGCVQRLDVYAVLTDDYATNKHRFRPAAIREIQLKATGTNIVNQDNLLRKESILESYHSGGKYYGAGTSNDLQALITCNPSNIYTINFKKPYDMSLVSESGSAQLGQLSVPSLRVVVAGTGGQFGDMANVITGNFDIHVVAYSTTLMSYNTSSSGSTNIRMIQN